MCMCVDFTENTHMYMFFLLNTQQYSPRLSHPEYASQLHLENGSQPHPESDSAHQDYQQFMELLEHMLELDPRHRIKPHEALKSAFITMSHLKPTSASRDTPNHY